MKNLIKNAAFFLLLIFSFNANAQIKNAKTETLKVYGNCGMCKQTIEKAINKDGEVAADWNKETKLLTVKYDPAKTSRDEILRKIAQAGYDNEAFRAPDAAYKNLPDCCQYDRPKNLTKNKK